MALIAIAPASAIIGGAASGLPPDSPARRIDPNTTASPWAGVGSLAIGTGTYTATAIDRRFVITAAHVVSGKASADITFHLNFGADLSHRIAVAAVHVHPHYRGFVPNGTSKVVHDDLAVLRLAQPLPAGVPIYRLYTARLAPGRTVALVGYGAGGDGVEGATTSANASVKRVGYNDADVFQPDDQGSGRIEIYAFDFDGPDQSSNRFGGGTLGNTIEASLAGGDSGSPALVQDTRGGSWLIAGVNTFIAGLKPQTDSGIARAEAPKFGSIGGGMLIAGYAEWIRSVIDAPYPEETQAAPASAATLWVQLALGGVLAVLAVRRT